MKTDLMEACSIAALPSLLRDVIQICGFSINALLYCAVRVTLLHLHLFCVYVDPQYNEFEH